MTSRPVQVAKGNFWIVLVLLPPHWVSWNPFELKINRVSSDDWCEFQCATGGYVSKLRFVDYLTALSHRIWFDSSSWQRNLLELDLFGPITRNHDVMKRINATKPQTWIGNLSKPRRSYILLTHSLRHLPFMQNTQTMSNTTINLGNRAHN